MFPYTSEGSVWRRSEPGHSYSVGVWSFLEIGQPGGRKATLEPQMQREEHSGYFKYGVLPISISVWFPLPKMRIPLLLVLFHKTLLAGTGKQWGLQPYRLQGQTALSVCQASWVCTVQRQSASVAEFICRDCTPYCLYSLHKQPPAVPQVVLVIKSVFQLFFLPHSSPNTSILMQPQSNLLEFARPQRRWWGHIPSCTAVPT